MFSNLVAFGVSPPSQHQPLQGSWLLKTLSDLWPSRREKPGQPVTTKSRAAWWKCEAWQRSGWTVRAVSLKECVCVRERESVCVLFVESDLAVGIPSELICFKKIWRRHAEWAKHEAKIGLAPYNILPGCAMTWPCDHCTPDPLRAGRFVFLCSNL